MPNKFSSSKEINSKNKTLNIIVYDFKQKNTVQKTLQLCKTYLVDYLDLQVSKTQYNNIKAVFGKATF
jgi:ribosomal protein L7Ae-like RNA K-turn-binding protein